LRNAERKRSAYDLIAVDLPWLGEFVEKGVIRPHGGDGCRAARPGRLPHRGLARRPLGRRALWRPSQTTPELMFYRRDWFAREGLAPPVTTDDVIAAARHFHDPRNGRYGVAWNAARGTALGHTFMMTCAAFGQPIIDLPAVAGGYDADHLGGGGHTRGSTAARAGCRRLPDGAAGYSPPDILSMSWYERVRPYAAGKVAMAYGYTLLAPYFELDETCPPMATPATCRTPRPRGAPIAPVGGYALCIPANLAEERIADAAEALIAFTSPGGAEALRAERQPHRAALFRRRRPRSAPPVADLRDGRSDVLERRAAILAAPADPADLGDHPLCGTNFTTCCAASSRRARRCRACRRGPRKSTANTSPLGRKTWTPIA
jgi:multiple sugar transport system substrate-binding protein